MLLLAEWNDQELAIVGYLGKAEFTYTIKQTIHIFFFHGV